jgi:alpha-tubulin suppressor-like RCC1 family protein
MIGNANAQLCIKQITTGLNHTVVVKTDGTLWAWGNNTYGQLGDGSTNQRINPIQIGSDTNWTVAVAGWDHTLALKSDGTLWSWGLNISGQLGLGDSIQRNFPVKVGFDNNWASISAGGSHTVALKTDGTLWAWGFNNRGQLGDGSTIKKTLPTQIDTAQNWKVIASGSVHNFAIKNDGTLWGWGANFNSQLGDATTIDRTTPTLISNANWNSVACSYNHTLAIKADGTLWAWGLNTYGQLGIGVVFIGGVTQTANKTIPTRIGTDNNWKLVDCGGANSSYSAAIKTDGSLWAWGYGSFGNIGDGNTYSWTAPIRIGNAIDWKEISLGSGHSIAVKSNQSLWGWGLNASGQLGDGTTTNKQTPTNIACPGGIICVPTSSILSVTACNSYYWVAKNKTYTSSNNSDTIKLRNALGCDSIVTLNLTINRSTFTTTTYLASGSYVWKGTYYTQSGVYTYAYTNSNGCSSMDTLNLTIAPGCFRQIASGIYHNLAIKTDGSLWTWGTNIYGIGDGSTNQVNNPVKIGTDTNWASISAGVYHNIAIKTNGTLWAWGGNGNGQLGDGTTASKLNPIQIGSANNWRMVSAGGAHTVAIKTDGTLWAWGNNWYGQLGDGTTIQKESPVQIGTATNWSSVSAGAGHTLAIKTDGTLWAWGNNNYSQLGDGSTIIRTIPLKIGTATNWKMVEAGSEHNLALKTDGSMWAWGLNSSGQLGIGTYALKSVPFQVGTAKNWSSISAARSEHSMAIKTDGTLWGWGNNQNGQLGIGNTTSKLSPFQVDASTNWLSISTGQYYSIAVKTDQILWSFGLNSSGQLGDGTAIDKSSPTSISCNNICMPTTSVFNIVACDSYLWEPKNKTYTSSNNTDTIQLTNAAGCDSIVTLNLTINTCNVVLNIKAFLQGYYLGNNVMNTTLYDLGQTNIVSATDTIQINLWESTHLANPISDFQTNAIIHSDGTASSYFPLSTLGKMYYVAIKHRNSIETWSSNPILLGAFNEYDFSSNVTKAYSDGINPPMVNMENGVYAIYSGDINQDGGIDAFDMQITENDASQFAFGYYDSDCSGDGSVDISDMQMVENNAGLFIFYARP